MNKNNIILAFIGLIFISFIVVLVIALNQRKVDYGIEAPLVILSDEKLIKVIDNAKENSPINQIRKEEYSKTFDEGNYEYDERTSDFRLVCERPCPVSKQVLDQEFAAISYAVSTLRGLTQSDIDNDILPFEVHASEDSKCRFLKEAGAYQTFYTDSIGNSHGLLCFFYDKVNYDRSKFPYSTSTHEVTHLFQTRKFPPYSGGGQKLTEGLAMVLDSFFEAGSDIDSLCWEGNDWFGKTVQQGIDTNRGHYVGGDLFFKLCNQHGFDYDDLPELFNQLEIRNGNVDEREFVNIINSIVGTDTSNLFRDAGVI